MSISNQELNGGYKPEDTACKCEMCKPPVLEAAQQSYNKQDNSWTGCSCLVCEEKRQKKSVTKMKNEAIEHPAHYTQHPSGVECITITEHMPFCLGCAVKYIWRAGLKDEAITDLKKAVWYLNREIKRREQQAIKAKDAQSN